MVDNLRYNPLSLKNHCLQYIILYLEQFPINSLALLPLFTRREILWNLDVCRLEKTPFTDGIEMEEYWNEKPRVDLKDAYCGCSVSNIKWSFTTPRDQPLTFSAKELCYAYVVNSVMMTRSH